jgi:hypothetical protein
MGLLSIVGEIINRFGVFGDKLYLFTQTFAFLTILQEPIFPSFSVLIKRISLLILPIAM